MINAFHHSIGSFLYRLQKLWLNLPDKKLFAEARYDGRTCQGEIVA
jgi:hypothetical protein